MHWVLVSYAEESMYPDDAYHTLRDGVGQTQLDADWDLIRNYAFKGAGSTLEIGEFQPRVPDILAHLNPLLEPSEGGYWSTGKNGKPIFWRD